MFVTLRHFEGSDGTIAVNWQDLDVGIEAINDRSRDMYAMLEELGSSLSTKLAHWEGSGGESFEDVKASWFTAANGVNRHLDVIRDNMQNARDVMYQEEMRAAGRFGG